MVYAGIRYGHGSTAVRVTMCIRKDAMVVLQSKPDSEYLGLIAHACDSDPFDIEPPL